MFVEQKNREDGGFVEPCSAAVTVVRLFRSDFVSHGPFFKAKLIQLVGIGFGWALLESNNL